MSDETKNSLANHPDVLCGHGEPQFRCPFCKIIKLRAQLDLSAEPDPNGTMAARLNWWKVESDELNEKWAETRRQLDAVTKERDAEKARLDFLTGKKRSVLECFNSEALWFIGSHSHINIRQAIDAAIAAEKGTK